MKTRASGVLLHLTSVPSAFGVGDLGPAAYQFAEELAQARQSYWQLLPLNPTDLATGSSPYHSTSAFAANPVLISPEMLHREGWLATADLPPPLPSSSRTDHAAALSFREPLFEKAFDAFRNGGFPHDYEAFTSEQSWWLEDFSLFMALKSQLGPVPWREWPAELRDRRTDALEAARKALADRIERIKFLQFVFERQWRSLKQFCNERGIRLIGDLPIYVQFDSADVWTQPELFKLDHDKRPTVVAGVPPDYFSSTGQLWGHPIYRWDAMKENRYAWWIRRFERNLRLFDYVRIDHFRGFAGYWEVPASETTAVNGRWVEGPSRDFFHEVTKRFPKLPIMAEDLGTITPDVRELMHQFDFPGMKILLFAFGPDLPTNPYAPHNVVRNCVVYTGTHDNNTARGWFEREATDDDRARLFRYLGRSIGSAEVPWELIRLAMTSVANTAIFPIQDILSLGEEARMNHPAHQSGNWQWRLLPGQLSPDVLTRLRELTEITGRA